MCDEKAPSCRSDISDLKSDLGGEGYSKFLTCAGGAGTCGEWIGCAIEHAKDDSVRRPDESVRRPDDSLPPQCARIDELCDAEEKSVRSECTRMIRNIRTDTASLGKLDACFGTAKNCYALDNCLDELWFELN